jgi:hypothetical protein
MRLLFTLLVFLNVSFSQDYVLICKGGSAYAYHKYECSGLKRCTHAVVKVSRQEAIQIGRTACKICYAGAVTPSKVVGSSPTPSSEAATSGQCKAITKKGTRCSRNARSQGYCWQHGG